MIECEIGFVGKSGRFSSLLITAATVGVFETIEVLLAAGAPLYDAGRTVNIFRTLVEEERPNNLIYHVLAHLLHTDNSIHACEKVLAYMRGWQEDFRFFLHVGTMQSSKKLLETLAALRTQRIIELLLGSSIDMADVRLPVLQAAAYFLRYHVLFELLPMVVISQPFPLEY